MIKNRANVNHESNDGVTPLYIASYKGHNYICELLIKDGANVNHKSNDGATPLIIAS